MVSSIVSVTAEPPVFLSLSFLHAVNAERAGRTLVAHFYTASELQHQLIGIVLRFAGLVVCCAAAVLSLEWLGDPDPFVMWDDEDWCVGGGDGGTAAHAAQPLLYLLPHDVCCAGTFTRPCTSSWSPSPLLDMVHAHAPRLVSHLCSNMTWTVCVQVTCLPRQCWVAGLS